MSVLVANRHKGDMIFPRMVDGKIMSNIKISPGGIEPIDDESWAVLSQNQIIKYYLDMGHLAVVKTQNTLVDVVTERTSDPPVPEHLQEEEFDGATGAKAKVRRSKSAGASTVEIN